MDGESYYLQDILKILIVIFPIGEFTVGWWPLQTEEKITVAMLLPQCSNKHCLGTKQPMKVQVTIVSQVSEVIFKTTCYLPTCET